jgi:hypothetical protein
MEVSFCRKGSFTPPISAPRPRCGAFKKKPQPHIIPFSSKSQIGNSQFRRPAPFFLLRYSKFDIQYSIFNSPTTSDLSFVAAPLRRMDHFRPVQIYLQAIRLSHIVIAGGRRQGFRRCSHREKTCRSTPCWPKKTCANPVNPV